MYCFLLLFFSHRRYKYLICRFFRAVLKYIIQLLLLFFFKCKISCRFYKNYECIRDVVEVHLKALQWATDDMWRRVFCPASRLEEMKLLWWSEGSVCGLIMVYLGTITIALLTLLCCMNTQQCSVHTSLFRVCDIKLTHIINYKHVDNLTSTKLLRKIELRKLIVVATV